MRQRLNILIVEDESVTAMDIQETLEEVGHTVLAIADTYENALQAIRKYPPDLAIVDVKLRGSAADGIILAKELQQTHQTPVIFLTANSEPKTVQRAKEANPTAYLLKPFRPEELLIQIELAWGYFKNRQADPGRFLFFPIKNKGHKRIDLNEVMYVKASGANTHIFLAGEVVHYEVSTHLANVAQYFSAPNFFRLSRSLIVNLDMIDSIEAEKVRMRGKVHTLEISPKNRKELLHQFSVVKTKPLNG